MIIFGADIIDFLFTHDWIVAFFLIFGSIIVFVGLHYIFYDKIKNDAEENHIIAAYYQIAALFYAVLLAFVVVSSWESFEQNVTNTEKEVNSVAELYELSNRFPTNIKDKIEKEIVLYANLMIHEEWPAMQKNKDSPRAFLCANEILDSIIDIVPTNLSESNLQNQAFQLYSSFTNARRTRLYENTERFPKALLITLFLGAILTLPITFFIHSANKVRQLFMTGIISAFVGLLLSLFIFYQKPYQGVISVSTKGWQTLLQNIQKNYLSE